MNKTQIRLLSCLFLDKNKRRSFRFKYEIKSILDNNHKIYNAKYNKILKKLRQKAKTQKIRVMFYVTETTKWNLQLLYDAMRESSIFEPFVVVSTRPKYYSEEKYKYNLDFFKKRCDNVKIGYDVLSNKSIDLRSFYPDIIFYQQPWDLCSFNDQKIQYTRQFALTCYCPYPISEAPETLTTNIRWFHSSLWKHFIFNEEIAKQYNKTFGYKKSHNLVITGHPKLDVYKDININNHTSKNYVIYAPHHAYSFSPHKYATWDWNGHFILSYAKKHPEVNWLFKPHPDFKLATWFNAKLTTKEEIEEYCDEWKKIAHYYDDGDYFSLFNDSKCLITDCGSWLTEYLPSKKPVIHLRSKIATGYSDTNNKIMPYYYQAWNLEELEKHLDNVVLNNLDPMLEKRLELIKELKLDKYDATQNIINHLTLALT